MDKYFFFTALQYASATIYTWRPRNTCNISAKQRNLNFVTTFKCEQILIPRGGSTCNANNRAMTYNLKTQVHLKMQQILHHPQIHLIQHMNMHTAQVQHVPGDLFRATRTRSSILINTRFKPTRYFVNTWNFRYIKVCITKCLFLFTIKAL
jgi:hypothetical protein